MIIVKSLKEFSKLRSQISNKVAFVPTMGALHEGHLSLMKVAKENADHLIVSIFVNPTQFGPNEDLDTYPRDPEGDAKKCESMGCDLLFMPSVSEMYTSTPKTTVSVKDLTSGLCGAKRPGHFDGVTTVVSKLFNIVQPDLAVFGQKDYQQLATLRQMVIDLNFPVEIIGAPTLREKDGLAMSSRNLRLNPDYRKKAISLSQGLVNAHKAFQTGERNKEALEKHVADALLKAGLSPDYISCVNPHTLKDYNGEEEAVLIIAVFAGEVRLIDNLTLHESLPGGLKKTLQSKG